MDFKWTLSRPGIALEFETGSIKEAVGLLEEEGTQISEIFGLTMGAALQPTDASSQSEPGEQTATAARRPRGRPAKAVETAPIAVAPAPLPIPETATTLPPNALSTTPQADMALPSFLDRSNPGAVANLPPPPVLPSPPIAPAPPPVGVLGPKVVAALDAIKVGKPDGGQALSDWLSASGLTQKGASYDDACRAVLMTSDAKLTETGIPKALNIAA